MGNYAYGWPLQRGLKSIESIGHSIPSLFWAFPDIPKPYQSEGSPKFLNVFLGKISNQLKIHALKII